MLSKTMQEALNEQINLELYSAYVYLSMVTYFEPLNLPGFGHWMRLQAREEVGHAMKIFEFVHDRGSRVLLGAVSGPPTEFEGPLAVMRQALEHERHVTARMHELYALAVKENDYASQVMLHWFLDEQVEEERTLEEIVGQMELAGAEGPALLLLDERLGGRSGD